jgi:translation initiation factor 5B
MNKAGKKIGVIHQLQHDGKTISSVKVGQEVACSVQNITIGRQITEDDVFYTLPSSSDTKKILKRFTQKLNSEERNTLNEIVEIQRKINPIYGY